MVAEVIVTGIIILFVAHIFYHKVIKNTSGGCCCNKDGKSKKKCNK
ncbi:hypothetical protein [Clostridium saccharobutylicum]|uniref:Virus attachment protein p12 family protein n=1 Tax=Clostridium saccharobutylicum TaxID=169679 RepID=A0A1S8N232_CLOSA|nr:hypothetical protein [Clostridium saccharobutylicum]OOM10576.1 hypothetical protein CLOSAC_31970 [Clostridium saccharobutylicum]